MIIIKESDTGMIKEIVIEIGDTAPAFVLPNQDGQKIKLADYKNRWVVLYFYPKDDTPGCTTEACEFTDNIRLFDKLDATILGVSPDTPERHRAFIAKYNLKVTLLSDPEHAAMEKYGAWGVKKMYGRDVTGVIRSTYIIDPKGKVAHVWKAVKAAGHAQKVKEKLIELTEQEK